MNTEWTNWQKWKWIVWHIWQTGQLLFFAANPHQLPCPPPTKNISYFAPALLHNSFTSRPTLAPADFSGMVSKNSPNIHVMRILCTNQLAHAFLILWSLKTLLMRICFMRIYPRLKETHKPKTRCIVANTLQKWRGMKICMLFHKLFHTIVRLHYC